MLYVALVTGKNLFHLIKPNGFFTYFPSECIEVHKLNEKFLLNYQIFQKNNNNQEIFKNYCLKFLVFKLIVNQNSLSEVLLSGVWKLLQVLKNVVTAPDSEPTIYEKETNRFINIHPTFWKSQKYLAIYTFSSLELSSKQVFHILVKSHRI